LLISRVKVVLRFVLLNAVTLMLYVQRDAVSQKKASAKKIFFLNQFFAKFQAKVDFSPAEPGCLVFPLPEKPGQQSGPSHQPLAECPQGPGGWGWQRL